MNINVFPAVYKASVDAKMAQDISLEEQRKAADIAALRESKYYPTSKVIGVCTTCGTIYGFVSCVQKGQFESGVSTVLGGLIMGVMFGVALWILLKLYAVAQRNGVDKSVDRRETSFQEKKRSLIEGAEKEYIAYRNEFDEQAKRLSVQYAASDLAIEVINWMTQGFEAAIRTADRRPHVTQVVVPFQFRVYDNKITCNLGTYDFMLKRCRFLTSPLEQTALARGIASAIKVNIAMDIKKDISGTDPTTKIEYRYESDHVVADLVYSARNGYYKEAKSW